MVIGGTVYPYRDLGGCLKTDCKKRNLKLIEIFIALRFLKQYKESPPPVYGACCLYNEWLELGLRFSLLKLIHFKILRHSLSHLSLTFSQ